MKPADMIAPNIGAKNTSLVAVEAIEEAEVAEEVTGICRDSSRIGEIETFPKF